MLPYSRSAFVFVFCSCLVSFSYERYVIPSVFKGSDHREIEVRFLEIDEMALSARFAEPGLECVGEMQSTRAPVAHCAQLCIDMGMQN